MKVQRFFAADMREGIRLVREEMGADAVILSNQRMSGGVEIVATCEYEQATARPNAAGPTVNQRVESIGDGPRRDAPDGHGPLRKALGDALTQRILAEADVEGEDLDEASDPALGGNDHDGIRLPDRFLKKLRKSHKETSVQPAPKQEVLSEPVAVQSIQSEPEVGEMRAELRSMREMLDQCFGSIAWDAMGVRDPGHALLVERFVRMGFDGPTARKLAEAGPLQGQDELDWRNALARMSKAIPIAEQDLADAGGTFALLGPSGSGKTTTIAKLATRFALRHGADNVALVTMDCDRIAGQEQLRAYGRILNVPVRVVDQEHSLSQVLNGLRGKRLILIDTAGLNAADREFDAQLRSLSGCAEVRSLLVLPCTSQPLVLRSVCHAHARLKPAGCILTRLDESGQLGGAIGVAMREKLPVAYLSDGQQVPHDLRVARAYSLVSRAVALMQDAAAAEYGHELGQAARSKPMALQVG